VQLGNPVVLSGTGLAVLPISTLGVGTHNITATYNGNQNFALSNSNTQVQVVQVGVVVTPSLSPSGTSSVFGQTLSIQATVKGTSPGNPVPPDGEMVTFTDLTTSTGLGSAPLSKGTAVVSSLTGFAVGQHLIQASYAGDTGSGGSFLANTGTFTLTVNKAATTPTVTSSGTTTPPPPFGTDITFTVTVTANGPGSGTPTGSVSFYDGPASNGKLLGSNGLTGAKTTFDTTALSGGAHTVYAVYSGDSTFNPSTGTISQTINPDHTTTVLSESSNGSPTGSAFYGVPVSLSATVTANLTGLPVANGTVTFYDGNNSLGSVPVSGGVALFTVSNLALGNHTLTATLGSSNSFFSSSGKAPLTVNADTTTTVVTSSEEPALVFDTVTLTASVLANNGGTIIPQGTVNFWDGPAGTGIFLGSGTLGLGGRARVTDKFWFSDFGHGPNAHQINAVYNPAGANFNPNFVGSTGNFAQDVIYDAGISVSLAAGSPSPSRYGEDFTMVATVHSATTSGSGVQGSGTFLGTVTFYDAGVAIATLSNVGGSGTSFSVTLKNSQLASPLGYGTHSITAKYTPNAAVSDFGPAGPGAPLSQTIYRDPTTATITSPIGTQSLPYQDTYGIPLTFTAVATSQHGTIPAGQLTFFDGANTLQTVTLDKTGTATFAISTLSAGTTHQITAQYLGNGNLQPSPASAIDYIAVAQAQTSTAISATTGSPPAAANATVYGQAITFSATITTLSGAGVPAGTVTFSDLSTGGTVLGSTTSITPLTATSGVATIVYSALSVSATPHEIAANFSSSGNYGSSSSAQPPAADWFVTVSKANTTVTLSSSSNPSFVGQGVNFSARVAAAAPGSGVPTGRVAFYIDGSPTPFATVALSNGVATSPAVSNLLAGPHNVTATYLPDTDPNFLGSSTLNPFVQNVVTQTLAQIVGPGTINNAPVGSSTNPQFFSFQVKGEDAAGNLDYSANGTVTVSMINGPTGGTLVGQNNSLTFNFVSGIATIVIEVTKAGTYNLLIDAGNNITTTVTVNTQGRQL
jgi:hypothetical protein